MGHTDIAQSIPSRHVGQRSPLVHVIACQNYLCNTFPSKDKIVIFFRNDREFRASHRAAITDYDNSPHGLQPGRDRLDSVYIDRLDSVYIDRWHSLHERPRKIYKASL